MIRNSGPVIIIAGPKHSGKTSAGKALARLWEGGVAGEGGPALPGTARFVDLDDLVEERTGRSPRSLYREGPEIFRRAEAEALRNLLEGDRPEDPAAGVTIVAGGGGLADNREALELLKTGRVLTVYLELPVERAWERIKAAAEQTGELPPFLNTENPRETHRLLHERRARVYRDLAAFTVKAGDTPEETAVKILCLLGQLPEQGGE
ncbi:MAG: shikimate kinase [Treponema sp.]|jgi:shikimate kinase|nr:shikimate kinase [Treponema sp.]